MLETVLPKKDQRDQGCAQQIPIMTIWFGMCSLHHAPDYADGRKEPTTPSCLIGLNTYPSNATRAT